MRPVTNAEFATDSYAKGGHPFGFPAPNFVMHANQDIWPFGVYESTIPRLKPVDKATLACVSAASTSSKSLPLPALAILHALVRADGCLHALARR